MQWYKETRLARQSTRCRQTLFSAKVAFYVNCTLAGKEETYLRVTITPADEMRSGLMARKDLLEIWSQHLWTYLAAYFDATIRLSVMTLIYSCLNINLGSLWIIYLQAAGLSVVLRL
jgi:hypothetical protein